MSSYKFIEPEVAGNLGEKSIIDHSIFPPIVKKLHYEFDGWLGNDIVESFPCYIVTKSLKEEFEINNFTGINFYDVLISKSETFLELYKDKNLPIFFWMKINGKAYEDDFFIGENNTLAISSKVYSLLKNFDISQATFEDL